MQMTWAGDFREVKLGRWAGLDLDSLGLYVRMPDGFSCWGCRTIE
jgi:hypothetical protein